MRARAQEVHHFLSKLLQTSPQIVVVIDQKTGGGEWQLIAQILEDGGIPFVPQPVDKGDSTMICSNQLNREDALRELKKPICTKKQLASDKLFVLRHMGMEESEFDHLMQLPPTPHSAYATDEWKNQLISGIINRLRRN